jgi:hypothetical protein
VCAAGWITFRDVLTVNKRPVRDREERLLKLLQSPEASALAQARRIAQESARFNLGQITRTMNVPDMALEYLQPRHGARIRFETLRDDTIDGRRYAMTGETVDAVARYSDFRRFTVSTDEKLTKPPGR